MIFLYDKYINNNFDKHIIHKETLNKIKNLILDKNIPNIIFYSYYYSCKSILLNYILYLIYGEESKKKKTESITFNIYNNSTSHTINFIRNPNYIVYTFLKKVSYDKYILNELTKLFIENHNIKQYISDQKYRIIIIKNAEYLSIQAQSFLRRIMEKYSHICKFFFLSSQICPIILPIQSRCLKIRISNLSQKELLESINYILKQEKLYLPTNKINKLLKMTNNNLYESLLIIQKSTKNNKIQKLNKIELSYKKKLFSIINSFFTEKITINFFYDIRDILYKILIININEVNIIIDIKNIVFEILDNTINENDVLFKVKLDIITMINDIQIKINNGNKNIFYLESVIVKLFLILEKHKLTIP